MKRRIFVIGIIFAVALAFASVGFAAWQIVNDHGDADGEFVSYTIIDLNNITNESTKQAFLYNASGMYSETGLGNSTSFTIQVNAMQKDEPYDLTLTLIDYGILNGATISSVATTEINDVETTISNGNKVITISNISEATIFLVTYNIQTNDTVYQTIYTNLTSGSDEFDLRVTAGTENGAWTIDKIIKLTADFQDLMPVSKPIALTGLTYNGEVQALVNAPDNGTLYSLNISTGTNAGTYNITATLLLSGYCWSDNSSTDPYSFNAVISKKNIVSSAPTTDFVLTADSVYSFKYNSKKFASNENTIFDEISLYFYSIMGVLDMDKDKLVVDSIYNDYIFYGSSVSDRLNYNSKFVHGSTYNIRFNLNNLITNYKIDGNDITSNQKIVISKKFIYKTALMGTTYDTLENALSTSNAIVLQDYTFLSESKTIQNSLLLPYSRGNNTISSSDDSLPYANATAITDNKANKMSNKDENLYIELVIAQGKTLTISSGKQLIIGGVYGAAKDTSGPISFATVGSHSNIRLYDNSKIINSGILSCMGYIYYDSSVTDSISNVSNPEQGVLIESTGEFYIPFVVNEFTGGSYTYAAYTNNSSMPFNGYGIVNVQSEVKVVYGAKVTGYTAFYTGDISGSSWKYTNALIIGSGGLFQLNNNSFVIYEYDSSKFYRMNFGDFGLTTFNIYGNSSINSISMSLSFGGFNIPIDSSTTILSIPCNMNIIQKTGKLTVNSKIMIAAASYLIIESGASIDIAGTLLVSDGVTVEVHEGCYYGSHANAFDTFDSTRGHFIIDGIATIKNNGYFAGIIETNGSGKLIAESSCNTTVTYTDGAKNGDGLYIPIVADKRIKFTNKTSYTVDAQYYDYNGVLCNIESGNTYYGQTDSTHTKASYSYYSYNTSSTVTKTTNQSLVGTFTNGLSFNLNYYNLSNNAINIVTKNASQHSDGYYYEIGSSDLINPFNHFSTLNIYYDSGKQHQVQIGDKLYNNNTLYCDTMPIDYSINYVAGGYSLNTTHNSFNAISNYNLDIPEKPNETFMGWYTSSDFSGNTITGINSTNFEALYSLLNNGQLYLYAKFVSGTAYQISYIDDISTNSMKPLNYNLPATQNILESDLPYIINSDTSYLNNNLEELYIVSYIINGNEYTNYTLTTNDFVNGELQISVKYGRKHTIVYQITSANQYIRYQIGGSSLLSPGNVDTTNTYGGDYYWFDGSSMLDINDTITTNKTLILYTAYSIATSNDTNGDQVKRTIKVTGYYSSNNTSSPVNKNNEAIMTNSTASTTFYMYSAYNNIAVVNSISMTCNDGYESPTCSTSTPINVTSNITLKFSSSKKSGGTCLLPDTKVMIADGTQQQIQYLVPGDMVLVFNHETGMLDIAPVTFNEFEVEQWFNVIHLLFDNGANIGVISEHGFFDLDTMRYEYIDELNYQDFIGHIFYTIDGTPTTLIDAYVEEEYTMCYSLPTYYHLNLFTEGILSMPGGITGLFNIFEYGDNLQYDQEKMVEDINTYGLFTIEEFAEYGVTEEMFNAYAGQYLKVALGKGILTEEYLMYLIERYGKYTE